MKTKLKVGDSFEVVEVLDHKFIGDVFKTGGHTIEFECGHQLLNGNERYGILKKKSCFGQCALYLSRACRKPIGKLTITKVK